MAKRFRSMVKADEYAQRMVDAGFAYVAVHGWVDGFGQHRYIVEWR